MKEASDLENVIGCVNTNCSIFDMRSKRLVTFLTTHAPSIVFENERRLVNESLDDLIKTANMAKKYINSVEPAFLKKE